MPLVESEVPKDPGAARLCGPGARRVNWPREPERRGSGRAPRPPQSADPSGYDSELQRLDAVFRPACDVQASDRVLDVGCGTVRPPGAAALAAARRQCAGRGLLRTAIERARGLAARRGSATSRSSAVTRRSTPSGESFDLAISRFGTMFFHDAAAAFTNLARALRPAGRLVMMVWQAGDRNEWDVAIHRALGGGAEPVATSQAFSLADPLGRPGSSRLRVRRHLLHRRRGARLLRPRRARQPRPGSAASPAPASCWTGSIPTSAEQGLAPTAGGAVGTPARRRRLVRLTRVDRQCAPR